MVMIDKMRVQQILINLLKNAVDFSPKDSIIWVSLELKNESKFLINVCDLGIGINAEDRKHLFKPFYKGKNNR